MMELCSKVKGAKVFRLLNPKPVTTHTDPLSSGTVVAHVENQARRNPHAKAINAEGAWYSYRHIDQRANRIAHALLQRGAAPGDRIGVLFTHGLDVCCALLAIQKVGAVYVPLDPGLPAARIAHMVAECRARLVLAGFDAATRVAEDGAGWQPANPSIIFDMQREAAAIARLPTASPHVEVGPDDSLCVLYTSGSTGVPKGVELTHRNVVNCLLWMQEEYALAADDVMLHKTPYSFDVSMYELFWPLMIGARVAVSKPEGGKDPGYLLDLMCGERVTAAHFVPSMLAAMLEEPDVGRCNSLTRVFAAGEALSYALTQRFYERLPQAQLHNLYGPTEAGVVSCWYCPRREPRGVVPIGFPVANTRLHVLDEALQPVARGVEGELYIGGEQVARGYLERRDLTAERFITHPQLGRLYKSGDIVRELDDGALEYLGRRDLQVKIGGVRVELTEIEAQLDLHPGVVESVAGMVERPAAQPCVVAWYKRRGASVPARELHAWLRERLPQAMCPQYLVPLDVWPHLPNGKIARKQLPSPFGIPSDRRVEPPVTPVEKAVAAVWSEVLGDTETPIGRSDRFIDIGGNSRLAMQVVVRLRHVMGQNAALRSILMEPLASIARQIEADETVVQTEPSDVGALPAEPIQDAFFFVDRQRPLFGMLTHRDAHRDTGILICQSVGQEFMRAHRALKLLADRLADRGFAVMRFDYAGTGDSGGDFGEASTEEWLHNIEAAAGELRTRTGVSQIALLGLRLGGLLAANAANRMTDVNYLAVWDPPSDGDRWVADARRLDSQELLALNAQLLRGSKLPEPTGEEVLGMTLSARFDSLTDLSLPAAPPGRPNLYLRSADVTAPAGLPYEIMEMPDEGRWNRVQWLHSAWNPTLSLNRLVSRLSADLP
jgi:amino acid adenylation domain-containing protein